MLRFFNANKKNSIHQLNLILSSRKLKQKTKSALVKNILFNVKKNGDRAVFNYEKKFSNVKISSKKIQFSHVRRNTRRV